MASLPITLLAALPESLRENAWVHAALIAPVLLVSGTVLLRGRPGAGQALLVFIAFAALIGGMIAPSEGAEQGLTVAGTVLLLTAHWHRLRKAHPH